MADVTLEALLREGRTFPPPAGFVAGALVTDVSLHDRGDRGSRGVLGRSGG